ncbi:MAG: DUF4300 family protein [Sarcina sp.]
MKIKYLAIILASAFIFAGCGATDEKTTNEGSEKPAITENTTEEKSEINFTYSNLVDIESKDYLKQLLLDKGIKEQYITEFFEKVDFYNETMKSMKGLVDAKTESTSYDIEFDDLHAMDAWLALGVPYKDFNCRLTSFELYRDNIITPEKFEGDDLNLMVDLDSIKNNKLSKLNDVEIEKFRNLYSFVLTEPNLNADTFAKAIKDEMSKREVSIKEAKSISLINGWMYDYEFNESFIGHSGILINDNNKFIFLEKYSFETPYIMIEFDTKKDLYDYLMNRLDVDTTGNGIPPIIFENNDVMKY